MMVVSAWRSLAAASLLVNNNGNSSNSAGGRRLRIPLCSSSSSVPNKPNDYSCMDAQLQHLSRRFPFASTNKKTIITNANRNTSRASSSRSPPSSSNSEEQPPVVYQGVYGPWTIQPSDVQEVILYRSGLVAAAASFVLASSTLFLPSDAALNGFLGRNIDFIYAFGACGLGLSLYLIHIYVTEIKRTLQGLWVLGAFGSLAVYANSAQPAGKDLVDYVIQYPAAIWFVGPLFAALTGLVFKEVNWISMFKGSKGSQENDLFCT